MFWKHIGIFVLLEILLVVDSQVCTRRAVVTSTSLEPFLYTYRESYQTKCWYGGTCTKTRIRSSIGHRIVPTREVRIIQICCDGYMRDDTSADDAIVCTPICMPSCNNGYCKSPAECACNNGYIPDPDSPHSCLPHCSESCEHGSCVAPDTCECNFGYIFNGTCQPICTETCVNGNCTAPDTCECLDGFRMSENNVCEPYCSKGCDHGNCVQPETCSCYDGYVTKNEQCIPDCSKDCGNGTCIAPGLCDCDPGYVFENGTCEPMCWDPCDNGYCGAPFTCFCDPGYTGQAGNCVPYCSEDCGSGKCIAPDTCECETGFKFYNSCDPVCCKAYCSKPCVHGSCIEPEVCDCDFGFKKDFILDACVPHCISDCGNGTCIAPNVCQCHQSYEEKEDREIYEEPVCEPICKNCEGSCIKPYTCVCDSIFDTRNEASDGGDCDCFENCTLTSKQCERTICLLRSTIETSTELIYTTPLDEKDSYIDDGLMDDYGFKFEMFNSDATSDVNYEVFGTEVDSTAGYYTVVNNNGNTFAATRKEENKIESVPVWIYIVTGFFLILIATVILVFIVKRKAVTHLFRGGSYVVEEKSEESCPASHSDDLRLSSIEKIRRNSNG